MNQYPSPTTSGLFVTFNNYIIELICLNMDKKLCPRFWKFANKYWQAKYRREIKGVHNLLKNFEFLDNPLLQRTIIDVVRKLDIKSMLAKKTVDRVTKAVKISYEQALYKPKQMASHTKPQESVSSSEFVGVGNKTKMAKIKAIRDGKKANC